MASALVLTREFLVYMYIINTLVFNIGNYFFLLRKHLVLQVLTTKSHMRICSA